MYVTMSLVIPRQLNCHIQTQVALADFQLFNPSARKKENETSPQNPDSDGAAFDLTPALDNVSVSTGGSEYLSSVSSCQQGSPTKRRSLFSSYWQQNASGTPAASHPTQPPKEEPALPEEEAEAQIIPSGSEPKPSTPQRPIASIAGSWSHSSVPCLPTTTKPEVTSTMQRRTFSSSELLDEARKTTSCMRETRFSGTRSRSCSLSESASVRFDLDAVDVVCYDTPQERYAEFGWSEYFS
jgi:hypothetical protein